MLQVPSLWNSEEEFDTMTYRKLLVQVKKMRNTTRIIKEWGFVYKEGKKPKKHAVGVGLLDSPEVWKAHLGWTILLKSLAWYAAVYFWNKVLRRCQFWDIISSEGELNTAQKPK